MDIKISKAIIEQSTSIKEWWSKFNNYVSTCAQWSLVGYYIGLGDRHLDNILMTDTGRLVHIDFEYAIDIGLSLPVPEWMPFRLTNCIMEPLGCLGAFGLYFSEMLKVSS